LSASPTKFSTSQKSYTALCSWNMLNSGYKLVVKPQSWDINWWLC
jgi:hypothetical protein